LLGCYDGDGRREGGAVAGIVVGHASGA
jgi:hypothetical protein